MAHKILLQLDCDPQASSFDAVVAIDAGVERLLQYGGVTATSVAPLVHGAMFTRGGADLACSAIFVGGSDVQAGEELLAAIQRCFFGPVRVSVLLDSNGCNTTAAAAVLTAARHLPLAQHQVLVLGGTGPVGRRVARMLLSRGAQVRLASRRLDRAQEAAQAVRLKADSHGTMEPVKVDSPDSCLRALEGCTVLIAAGSAGVEFTSTAVLDGQINLRVAIDLNAVPPLGIRGIQATDKSVLRGNRHDYGALGVGGLKMKIHRAAVQQLFTSNSLVLDAEQILAIGQALIAP